MVRRTDGRRAREAAGLTVFARLPSATEWPAEPPAPARSWRELPVLLVVLALLAGAAALALLTAGQPPADDSPEAGFARDMRVHLAQGVSIALIARDGGQDPDVRALATSVALTEQTQIGELQGWLDVWRLPATRQQPAMAWMGHPIDGLMPGMASREQMAQLLELPPDALDLQFLRLMIPHHQAGSTIAEAVLGRSNRPEVRRLAAALVRTQQAEIEAMQDLLQRKSQPAVTGEPPLSAAEETEHGEHEGFTASVPAVARDTLRVGPLALAIFALAWLNLDDTRRRRQWCGAVAVDRLAPRAWQALAVGGLGASAVLHVGLAPEHFDAAFAYGLFFSISGGVLAAAAGAVLAWPSRAAYLVGLALGVALIGLYVLFRLVPPPGAAAPEEVDLVGLITKAAELAAVIACVILWLRPGRAEAHLPAAA